MNGLFNAEDAFIDMEVQEIEQAERDILYDNRYDDALFAIDDDELEDEPDEDDIYLRNDDGTIPYIVTTEVEEDDSELEDDTDFDLEDDEYEEE